MSTSRGHGGEPGGRPRPNTATNPAALARPYVILMLAAALALAVTGCRFFSSEEAAAGAGEPKKLAEAAPAPPPPDPVAVCGELAPEDPYEVDDEGAERAYAACLKAAEAAPNDAETLYRLGLSATQSNLPDEAVESFRKAEQLGHCGALYFLGDDAWYGGRRDAASAEAYYKRGAECGDARAARELFSPEVFAASAHKDLIEALYNSDTKTLNRVRFASASYVAGFYEALSEQYLGIDFDPCWTTTHYSGGEYHYDLTAAEKGDAPNAVEGYAYEKGLPIAFQILLPEQGSKGLEEFRQAERKAGHADLNRLIRASKCDAFLPYKLVKGVEAFARSKRTLLEVVTEAAPNINSHDDLVAWLRQKGRQSTPDIPRGR